MILLRRSYNHYHLWREEFLKSHHRIPQLVSFSAILNYLLVAIISTYLYPQSSKQQLKQGKNYAHGIIIFVWTLA